MSSPSENSNDEVSSDRMIGGWCWRSENVSVLIQSEVNGIASFKDNCISCSDCNRTFFAYSNTPKCKTCLRNDGIKQKVGNKHDAEKLLLSNFLSVMGVVKLSDAANNPPTTPTTHHHQQSNSTFFSPANQRI